MKISIARMTPQPFKVSYISSLGIQSYDIDNLYPQNARKIIKASKNGMTCLTRFIDFIEGNGVHDDTLAMLKVNRKNQRLDDINELVASDMGYFYGFALHVNYNVLGQIVELQHVPFENCRLAEPDALGNVTKIVVHPDWTGHRTRNGKIVAVKRDNCDYIDVFNPDPKVVMAQIIAAGGIDKYKGQIYYYSSDGYMTYPSTKYHSVLNDLSTDAGCSTIMNRNVKNNFLPSGILVHYAERRPVKENDLVQGEPVYEDTGDGFFDAIKSVQGDENCGKILEVTIENEKEKPEFIEFPAHNFDKDFTATTSTIEDSIYAVFNQENFLCIRRGKLGFSGQVSEDAKREYAQLVRKIQRHITMAYMDVLQHWAEPLAVVPTFDALTVESLVESVTSIAPNNANDE